MNANGGLPSGPFQFGPPSLETSTNKAFSCCTRAIGKDIAIVTGTGVNITERGRRVRTTTVGTKRSTKLRETRCVKLEAVSARDGGGVDTGSGRVRGGISRREGW